MSYSQSIGIQVLDIIIQVPKITPHEIAKRITGGWAASRPESVLESVNRVLADLKGMKLVGDDQGVYRPLFLTEAAERELFAEPPPPGSDVRPPDGDEEPGDGIRQVIANPHLFVLRKEEVAQRIREAIGLE